MWVGGAALLRRQAERQLGPTNEDISALYDAGAPFRAVLPPAFMAFPNGARSGIVGSSRRKMFPSASRSSLAAVVLWATGVAGLLGTPVAAGEDARLAFFEQRVRPVLVEHCYECHSAGSKKLKGGLRLDSRAGLLRGGDTRAAVVPGDTGRSLMLEAIGYTNRDLQMPPKGRLPDAVVADLTKWVNDGAFDPREDAADAKASVAAKNGAAHWAFQPIRESALPPIRGRPVHQDNPVDRFIGAKLAEVNLTPAPSADRRTLIRRVTYDLTGLPPTSAEIAAFVNDPAPDAFGRVVERLLASPRYGERWARWWLDVARYADTNGQDENKVMANAWRYRDWVIRSFNANQPFDAFITEQLAGDLLPTNGVSEQALFDRWTATGFLVLGPKMLAEQDKPKLVMDLVDEQIDVVSRAFLGLTVGCARCHDHKFDPISARDYYALAGIFKSTKTMENLTFVSKFNERRIATADQIVAIESHAKQFAAATNAVQAAIQTANAALLDTWKRDLNRYLAAAVRVECEDGPADSTAVNLDEAAVKSLRALVGPDPSTNALGRTLRSVAASPERTAAFLRDLAMPAATGGLRLAPGKVGAAFLATGSNHLELSHSPALEPALLTVEAWVRASEFPKDGDTRRWLVSKNANEWAEGHYALLLNRDRVGAYLNIGGGRENVFAVWSGGPALQPDRWHHLAFTYDGAALRLCVDGQPAGETVINRARVSGTNSLVLGRRQDGYIHFKGLLDEARVFNRALSAAELKAHFEHPEQPAGDGVVARWEFNDLTEADRSAVAQAEAQEALFGVGGVFALPKDPRPRYPAATRETIVALEREPDTLKAATPAPAAFALAVVEDQPVDLPVHIRGSHLNLAKEPVPRGFIQAANRGAVPDLPKDRSGRLELAGWLTSPDNPLTARVIVNRIWQAHFGEGLVRTPDNFGVRGESPSHPELLDWLAGEFIRSGWDVKQLHRLILGSATWRQAGGRGKSEAGSRNQKLPASHLALPTSEDPDNRLLAHFPRQRLEAEMVRDALLAVSGRLDAAAGGSLVAWKNDDYTPTDDVSAVSTRRSVYLPIVRDRVFDVFTIFDFANPSVGTSKRSPTVVSHQALFFLNSPLVKESARAFAAKLLADSPHDQAARIDLAYERAFGRPPAEAETQRAVRFVAAAARGSGAEADLAAWAAWCQTLFAANEFLYRE